MLPSYLIFFFKTLVSIIFAVHGLLFNSSVTLLVATILAPTSTAYYSIIKSFIYTKKISALSLLIYTLIGIVLPIVLSLICGYVFSFIKDKDEKLLIEFENNVNDANAKFEKANIIYTTAQENEAAAKASAKAAIEKSGETSNSIDEEKATALQVDKEAKSNELIAMQKTLLLNQDLFHKAETIKNDAEKKYDEVAKKLVSYSIPSYYMKERLVYHPVNLFFTILLPFVVCFFLHYSIEKKDVRLIIGISIALSFTIPLVDIGLYIGNKIFKTDETIKIIDYIIPLITFISNFLAVVVVSFISIRLKK